MNFVHDNEILSYQVDLSNQLITLYTDYNGNFIDLCFTDVMAHMFETELPGSIILDIEQRPVSLFFEENQRVLEERKNQCWPKYYKEIDELKEFLENENYLYFIICSSYGLNGWILAKSVVVKKEA